MPSEIIVGGLIILGFILILMEIFLIPGFNIFGVVGFILVVFGIIFAYTKLNMFAANLILISSIILSFIIIRLVVKSKTWNRMVLSDRQEKSEGFHSSLENLHEFIGKTGVTYTKLRPSGVAMIDDKKVDVVTEGNFIDEGSQIKVIKVEGNRVVVKEV